MNTNYYIKKQLSKEFKKPKGEKSHYIYTYLVGNKMGRDEKIRDIRVFVPDEPVHIVWRKVSPYKNEPHL